MYSYRKMNIWGLNVCLYREGLVPMLSFTRSILYRRFYCVLMAKEMYCVCMGDSACLPGYTYVCD